jgi:hypothetical protein
MQGVPVSCQAHLHTDANIANDPALMAVWRVGLDILGPFLIAIGGFQYLYVTIDKFTK